MRLGDIPRAAALEDARFYFEIGNINEEVPELLSLAPDAPTVAKELNLSKTNLWASVGGGTVSLVHSDDRHNILAQVHGVKEFFLWPPEDRPLLGYHAKSTVEQTFSCCPASFTRKYLSEQLQRNMASVDLVNPEETVNRTKPVHCRVGPGDALV